VVDGLQRILAEADGWFMGRSNLHEAARRLARIFQDMGIDYAVAGAMALAAHGRRRMTEDIDILVTAEDLVRFKTEWLGRGYVEIKAGLKAIRDTDLGVRIDFIVSGQFPGDGKPKSVAFPVPQPDYPDAEGLRVLPLDVLIELKLASGMTAPHRGQDLVDVMELVRARQLPRELADELDPFVRAEFERQWQLAQIGDDA
jgi:hypothetical protein